MTRVAFIKLLVVVLMAFILCLPEFFTSDQAALSIDSPCLRLPLCMGNASQRTNFTETQLVRDTGRGFSGGCVNISTCEGMASRTRSSIECFLCPTERDLRSLRHKSSQSEVERRRLLCCSNCTAPENESSMAPRPLRSCCVLYTLAPNSAECSPPVLWTRTSKESWCSGRRLLWLVFILIVIILVIGSVVYEVKWKSKGCIKKQPSVSVSQAPDFPVRYLKDKAATEMTTSEIMDDVYFNSYTYRGSSLSPIHEETAFIDPSPKQKMRKENTKGFIPNSGEKKYHLKLFQAHV